MVGGGQKAGVDMEKEVERCLEMVAISRVFDVEGLWEVLGEIGRGSGRGNEQVSRGLQGDTAQSDPAVHPQDVPIAELPTMDGGTNNVRDGAVLAAQSSTSKSASLERVQAAQPQRPTVSRGEEDNNEGTEIIIIDNMTHLINELFTRKEKGEAHVLLTNLSPIIHTQAHSNNILTILHNGTTKSAYSSRIDAPSTARRQPQQTQVSLTSIFTGNPVKPALGRIFDQFTELHLLLSQIPKTREDAEMLYGQDNSPFNSPAIEYCTVVEVLKDETPNLGDGMKFGAREQRWAAVKEAKDGLGLVSSFQEKGTMKGMGLSRDRPHDVGSIAKVYGFGGRRV